VIVPGDDRASLRTAATPVGPAGSWDPTGPSARSMSCCGR